MDNVKIGEFIKNLRKEKNLTQGELAEKLSVSPKTISKWECGMGAPDVSIMMDLCKELGITVNELLCGEKIEKENYMENAEKNFITVLEDGKRNKKNTKALVFLAIASLVNVLFVLGFIAYVMEYGLLEWMAYAVIAFEMIILFATIFPICIIDNGISYFECKNCGKRFRPKDSEYINALHAHTSRLLTCPHCGKKTWCKRRNYKTKQNDEEKAG
jgi:transcriptional regulator with XRE-family HTH domain